MKLDRRRLSEIKLERDQSSSRITLEGTDLSRTGLLLALILAIALDTCRLSQGHVIVKGRSAIGAKVLVLISQRQDCLFRKRQSSKTLNGKAIITCCVPWFQTPGINIDFTVYLPGRKYVGIPSPNYSRYQWASHDCSVLWPGSKEYCLSGAKYARLPYISS